MWQGKLSGLILDLDQGFSLYDHHAKVSGVKVITFLGHSNVCKVHDDDNEDLDETMIMMLTMIMFENKDDDKESDDDGDDDCHKRGLVNVL
jgi:hypothetical protein